MMMIIISFSVYNYCDVAKGFLNWTKIGYNIDNKG